MLFRSPTQANVPLALRAEFNPGTDPLQLQLTWPAQLGLRYRIVYRDNLTTPWQTLTSYTATESVGRYVDVTFGKSQRFYGLLLEHVD